MARSGSRVLLCRALAAGIAAPVALSEDATAQSPTSEGPAPTRFEVWSGAQVFGRVWSLYSGGMYAPFGSIREDGLRLRVVAGYGDYGSGTLSFADLLIGYHKQLGPLTLKVLAGVTADHRVDDEQQFSLHGPEPGGKVALEAWWNVTDQAWLSTDVSWSSLDTAYSSRVRLGWRLGPAFSAGLEGGAAGALETDVARVGGFVRYEWASGEVSVSGGLAGEGPGSGLADVHGPFATLGVLTRF